MNIFITLDYELFFGPQSGSVEHCMIRPTNNLLKILDPYNIKISFFVDSGYLLALEKFKTRFPELEEDYVAISNQIKKLTDEGHGIELHVHPHWEDSYYHKNKWVFDTSRYKLADFNEKEILAIVSQHSEILGRMTGRAPVAYRAGGWSIQPFEPIGKALRKNNILLDSTAYSGGYFQSPNQVFDFRGTPSFVGQYLFTSDPARPEENGKFTEIPISAIRVSPLFFWKMVLNKMSGNKEYQAYGDGEAIKNPKSSLLRMLTMPTSTVVSMDGFKCSLLEKAFATYQKRMNTMGNFVIIGHPKAFTPYSLKILGKFVKETAKDHNYNTFRNFKTLKQA